MQEEVENRTVSLAIRSSKLTADVLKKAITKYLAYRKEKSKAKAVMKPTGKQTVKELIGQNQGVSNIEITEKNIKGFDRVARKYGVDYAIKKTVDENGKSRYMLFFKGRDEDAIIQAFQEYTKKVAEIKNDDRPSIHKLLNQIKAILPGQGKNREKNKEIVR